MAKVVSTWKNQKVLVEGSSSSTQPVLSGVPQGTVLGPLLFLIYINDIDQDLSPGTSIRLFADDSLLYRTINIINDTSRDTRLTKAASLQTNRLVQSRTILLNAFLGCTLQNFETNSAFNPSLRVI